MRTLIATLLLLTACSAQPSDTDPAEIDPCTELRDHLVELRVSEAQGVDQAPHRAALLQALGSNFVTTCSRTLTAQQVKCALAASSVATAAECNAPNAVQMTSN